VIKACFFNNKTHDVAQIENTEIIKHYFKQAYMINFDSVII